MTQLTSLPKLGPALPPPNACLKRFTIGEYHRLTEIGVLTEDDDVELVEGWILHKMSRNPPHDYCVDILNELLRGLVPASMRIRIQSAITLANSEPEPDLAVVQGPAARYRDHHPGPSEIGMLVEVSEWTLAQDRDLKGQAYARAGVPVYWIVNLVDRQIEVYTDPDSTASPPVYRKRQDHPLGSTVPVVLQGHLPGNVAVQDILS